MSTSTSAADTGRRRLLGSLAGVLVGVGPGVFLWRLSSAKPPRGPASGKNRWGFLIDTDQCAKGCDACVRICLEENGIQSHGRPLTDPKWIRICKLPSDRVANKIAVTEAIKFATVCKR